MRILHMAKMCLFHKSDILTYFVKNETAFRKDLHTYVRVILDTKRSIETRCGMQVLFMNTPCAEAAGSKISIRGYSYIEWKI